MSISPPPVYTVSNVDFDAPPPSYESVTAPKNNHNNATPSSPPSSNQPSSSRTSCSIPRTYDSARRVACCADFKKAPLETRFNVVACSIFFILDIISLIIGAIYFEQCNLHGGSLRLFCVLYGIGAGLFHAMSGLEEWLLTVKRGLSKEEREKKKPGGVKLVHGLLALFGLGYFIYGCVIVFGGFDSWVSSPTTDDNYCHPVMFHYAFFMIVFSLSFIAFILILIFLVTWGKWICGKE